MVIKKTNMVWLCGACGQKVTLPKGEVPGKCPNCASKRAWSAAPLVVVK